MVVVMMIITLEIHIHKVKHIHTNIKFYIMFSLYVLLSSFFSVDNSQSSSGRGWKNYNTGGSGGPSKPTGNQGGRYGGRNTPYTRQK